MGKLRDDYSRSLNKSRILKFEKLTDPDPDRDSYILKQERSWSLKKWLWPPLLHSRDELWFGLDQTGSVKTVKTENLRQSLLSRKQKKFICLRANGVVVTVESFTTFPCPLVTWPATLASYLNHVG